MANGGYGKLIPAELGSHLRSPLGQREGLPLLIPAGSSHRARGRKGGAFFAEFQTSCLRNRVTISSATCVFVLAEPLVL